MKYLIVLIFPLSLWATEIDSFTGRYQVINDSIIKLDRYMNEQLDISINKVNIGIDCTRTPVNAERKFYDILYDQVGGYLWARIENKITETNYVQKIEIEKEDSIYRDLDWINAFVLKFAKLGATINMNGHMIGTDKLGHFVAIGWEYFKKAKLNKEGLEKALEHGYLTERTFFGEMTTGVYSYADLAVNYDGYLFWSQLFNSYKTPTSDPYIKCINNKLVKVRDFSWSDYVTGAWDEAVNCNTFRNEDIKQKIENQILKLEEDDPSHKYQCPVRACDEFRSSYPEGLVNC